MSDDDLIRRGDVLRLLQSGAGLTLNGQARRVAALPAVTSGVRVKPTVDEVAQIIRTVDGENRLGAGELAERILAALDLTPQPAPDVARLVEAMGKITAARKTQVDLVNKYNAKLDDVKERRKVGDWSRDVTNEAIAMHEAQRVFIAVCQEVADAALAAMEGKP